VRITKRQIRRIIREAVEDLPPHVTASRPGSDFASSKEWAQQFSDPARILYVEKDAAGRTFIEHEEEGELSIEEIAQSLGAVGQTDFLDTAEIIDLYAKKNNLYVVDVNTGKMR
jgi:hypothetical protein